MNEKVYILVVDDEPVSLKRVGVILKDFYELRFARSGEEALAYINNNYVDLILLDIHMNGMDGFEVTKHLRNHEATSSIPIVYLTGNNSVEMIEQAFDLGAADYIVKPFRNKELISRVKHRIETENLKRNLKHSLKKNEHLLQIINNYVAYLKTDTNGIIVEISQSFLKMLQCDYDLSGTNVNILKSGNTPTELYKELWETIEHGMTFSYEIENRNFIQGTNWYHSTIIPDINDNGTLMGYIAFYINIDEKVNCQHDAQTDFLTGLNNRAKFEAELSKEFYRSQRYDSLFSIILIDIDHFKTVNDTYGHDAGDTVLKEFSSLLAKNIRKSDILSRWGGEEFMILCPNTDAGSAASLAEILRVKIEEHLFSIIGHKTASFGVAQYIKDKDQKSLFMAADSALYEAKEQGRNKVFVC